MAPRDKKGILFISRVVVQSYLSLLCVRSRLANVLLRFNLDNKFQRGGGTESYACEQTLENQSSQLSESALSSRSPHFGTHDDAMFYLPFVSKVTTSNPFTSTVRSCKGPTAYNCFDVFSPDSRLGTVWKSEHCEEVRFCSLLTTSHGAVSAMVLKSQEDSSPSFVSLSLRHQGKQRLGNSI